MKRTRVFDEKGLQAFAARLKEIRKQLGVTQEELSFKSGLELSQIARIETCKINPTLSTVFIIARALNIQVKELFDFELT
ncbi:MAG: transcriptional regulator [Bacteroidetes bacterium GWA2_31_9]|nr:MAG: transcriptional regulator [Bacteroidetes bacterium GWA2_31_9]